MWWTHPPPTPHALVHLNDAIALTYWHHTRRDAPEGRRSRDESLLSAPTAPPERLYTHTHTHRYSSPTEKWHRTCSQRAYYGKPAEKLLRIDLQSLQQTLAYSFNRVIFEDLLQYKPMFAYNRECHKETYLWNLTWDKYHHKTHLPLSTHISLSKVS